MSVFKINKRSSKKRAMFFDGSVDIARYDDIKYPQLDKFTDKQLGFFWRPEEVDILRDNKDFKDLSDAEQHIFTSNLKRQILLDSVQGRAPNLAFLPIVSLPELETWIETWSFSETIHSRSYTHIIRNIYSDPSVVFDNMLNIKEITDCSDSISRYYDDLIRYNDDPRSYGTLQHKKALWLCLNAVNALEGVRFYVSFACSWAFAELKKMEGNAKIIKFIARDENLHLGSTTSLNISNTSSSVCLAILAICGSSLTINLSIEVVEPRCRFSSLAINLIILALPSIFLSSANAHEQANDT